MKERDEYDESIKKYRDSMLELAAELAQNGREARSGKIELKAASVVGRNLSAAVTAYTQASRLEIHMDARRRDDRRAVQAATAAPKNGHAKNGTARRASA